MGMISPAYLSVSRNSKLEVLEEVYNIGDVGVINFHKVPVGVRHI